MNRLHPASIFLLGLAVLLAISMRTGLEAFLGGAMLALIALVAATSHLRLLLRRSRWLLLTMLVMFGWFTPGTPVPSIPGASQEGLRLAADNIARLLMALATVAVILKLLPPPDLVAGIRSLLTPLAPLKISRDRIAVRLALTLRAVEESRNAGRGEAAGIGNTLSIPASSFGAPDLVAGTVAGALVVAAWWI